MEINASHRNVEWCSMSLLNMKYVRQSREQILVDNLNIHNNVHLMCLKGTVYRHFSKTWGKWNWKVRHDSYMILFQICFCVLNRPTELNVCAINQKQHFTHHNIFHSKCHLIKYISVYFYLCVSFFSLISLPLHPLYVLFGVSWPCLCSVQCFLTLTCSLYIWGQFQSTANDSDANCID